MSVLFPLVVAALLFAIGVYGVLARRNAVLVLMGVELMLNAVNLNLVAFDAYLRDVVHSGQVLTLFVIAIAAAEIGLGLAIVLMVFRSHRHIDVDRLRELSDSAAADEAIARDAGTPTCAPGSGA
ncbi:MAG TPA: NADH-quinone oxidoreductase subunit NuoK [Nocardioidaceae bacterium]|nr:NADH-quinone oxidoreductase subunit NuoK [Nocardioidaceae bacterium]